MVELALTWVGLKERRWGYLLVGAFGIVSSGLGMPPLPA